MRKKQRGLLIVLSSPSGGGKTTVAGRLLKRERNIVRSVSCTTRKPRQGEKNGRDYFFVTSSRFKTLVSQRAFLEWAHVHRHRYGTPRRWVEQQLGKGRDVLFVIDVQGGMAIKRNDPQALLLFLGPPSFTVLKKRLIERGNNSRHDLRVRLKDAKWEIKEGEKYDYQVVNDRLGRAVLEIVKIIRKERKKNQDGTKQGRV